MSRIGRAPIAIPAGVTVTVAENNYVTVKGPKGVLSQNLSPKMTITVEENNVVVTRPSDEKEDKSLHGLTRALLNNMVVGVTNGYEKKLEIVGVGYKVVKTGKTLQLFLGHSLVPGKAVPQDQGGYDHYNSRNTDAAGFKDSNSWTGETSQADAHKHTVTTTTVGSGTAFDNRPSHIKAAFFMKIAA